MDSGKKLLIFAVILLGAIAAAHGAAIYYFLYWRFWWMDMVMHFAGGFWLGLAAVWFLRFSDFSKKISVPPRFLFFIIAAVSAFGGVAWEFLEFFWDLFFAGENYYAMLQIGAMDTMSDLFFDVLGGLAAGTAFLKFFSSKNNYEPR